MAISMSRRTVRLAIVGDVHDEWDAVSDAKALEHLKPDLVLFTGDFGNYANVRVVKGICRLDLPKAAILGNHDCWFKMDPSNPEHGDAVQVGRPLPSRMDPSNPEHGDAVQVAVQEQLDLLGMSHVGYSRADFPDLHLSVVGGRPGSGGGEHIGPSSIAKKLWNIRNLKKSTERIIAQALAAPADHSLVFLAHNGPTGLGSSRNDICGKDWTLQGGDHGDPDLAWALSHVKVEGKRTVPLVVFGHMHKELQHKLGDRKMIFVGEDKSIYLNAAVVPRTRSVKAEQIGSDVSSWLDEADEGITPPSERNFTVVDLVDGEPKKILEVWVRVAESAACIIGEQTLLYSSN